MSSFLCIKVRNVDCAQMPRRTHGCQEADFSATLLKSSGINLKVAEEKLGQKVAEKLQKLSGK